MSKGTFGHIAKLPAYLQLNREGPSAANEPESTDLSSLSNNSAERLAAGPRLHARVSGRAAGGVGTPTPSRASI